MPSYLPIWLGLALVALLSSCSTDAEQVGRSRSATKPVSRNATQPATATPAQLLRGASGVQQRHVTSPSLNDIRSRQLAFEQARWRSRDTSSILRAATQSAELVVLGTVVGTKATNRVALPTMNQSTVSISDVWKGRASSTLVVTWYSHSEATAVETGRSYVFFLKSTSGLLLPAYTRHNVVKVENSKLALPAGDLSISSAKALVRAQ